MATACGCSLPVLLALLALLACETEDALVRALRLRGGGLLYGSLSSSKVLSNSSSLLAAACATRDNADADAARRGRVTVRAAGVDGEAVVVPTSARRAAATDPSLRDTVHGSASRSA